MRIAELEQTVRARDFELQMKDAELNAVSKHIAVVHATNEIVQAESDEVVEAVTRAQDESYAKEEEVQDLYNRLAMAEQIVTQAHSDVAQKEEALQEIRKKVELLEGWLREKDAELEHSHKEMQKSIQSSPS
jgi:chromosome segregation ATPase